MLRVSKIKEKHKNLNDCFKALNVKILLTRLKFKSLKKGLKKGLKGLKNQNVLINSIKSVKIWYKFNKSR